MHIAERLNATVLEIGQRRRLICSTRRRRSRCRVGGAPLRNARRLFKRRCDARRREIGTVIVEATTRFQRTLLVVVVVVAVVVVAVVVVVVAFFLETGFPRW